jgi:ribonuclease HII
MQMIAGIDEAGRGPLAGPVAVGVVKIPADFNTTTLALRGTRKNFFKGIKDSKQLTPEERELWFNLATEARKKGELDFRVSLISERIIDKHGISYALRLGIRRCLAALGISEDSQIFLDGSLAAPSKFKHQTTVVRGDEKIPVISLASICAKVIRDRRMVRMAKKFPQFEFDIHKGYGTRRHLSALQKYGLTAIHRRSFLRNLTLIK